MLQAKSLGIVDQVVDRAQVLEAAEKVMAQLIKVGGSICGRSLLCVQGKHDLCQIHVLESMQACIPAIDMAAVLCLLDAGVKLTRVW